MSRPPVKPESINFFESPEDKENCRKYANQNIFDANSSNTISNTEKDVNSLKVKESKPKCDSTKEILKMIVDMNNVYSNL